tara:strand:- start:102 stop:299 length:198 start_codon:yes stop_codon:yes gene_type:complete
MLYRNIFRIFIKEDIRIMGRWKKVNDQQILDYKIHLANSDSCYHSTIYNKENNYIINNINDKSKR